MQTATIKKHQRALARIRKAGGRVNLHEAHVVNLLLTWCLNARRSEVSQ